MNFEDTEYYRKRAIASREMVAAASDPVVARIHEELAVQYEALSAQPELRPTLRLRLGGARAG